LRDGPAYGSELIRLLGIRPGSGRGPSTRIYSVLQRLESDGLVRSSVVVPGERRGGRARRYYDLTTSGIAESSAERRALLALLVPEVKPPTARERERMVRRLEEMEDLFEAGRQLQAAMAAVRA
jgi:DNA-binding PadR family transcriptional regulator